MKKRTPAACDATCVLSLVLAATVLGSGCAVTLSKSKSGAATHDPKNVAVTQNQVRLRMRAAVEPICGELEQSADAIIAGTTNRAVQRAALQWKIEGVPALRRALFQPDPMTAVFDTWVLLYQMADFFEKGRGKELLGEASTQAVADCQRMEEILKKIAVSGSASGDV